MKMGFLPWEKWLPRYIYGPGLCAVAAISGLLGGENFEWFEWLVCTLVFLAGLLLTYAWFRDRRSGIL